MVDRPDPESLDHFEVLGLSPKASRRDVKRAYRQRAAAFHPDTNPGDEEAPAILRRLNWAYAVLSDPVQRARYHDLRGFDPPPNPDAPPSDAPPADAPPAASPPPRPAPPPPVGGEVRAEAAQRAGRTRRKRTYARDVAREARRQGAMNAEAHAAMMGQITQAMAAAQRPADRPWLRWTLFVVLVGLLAAASWARLEGLL